KCVDGSGLGQNFATVQYAPWDEVLLSGLQWNPLPVDDQGIAALNNDHVFVVIMHVHRGGRSFPAGPKRHLAPVCPIEYVTLDSWGRLVGPRNPVCWIFHELGEFVHSCELVSHASRPRACVRSRAAHLSRRT